MMKSLFLKFIYIGTIGVTLSNIAMATSCNDLRQELMVVENHLQNSCINEGITDPTTKKIKRCCENSSNLNCIKKSDLEAKYNDVMARLIVAEGITSIGMALESNHNALAEITSKKHKEAKTQLKDMRESLNKADLLYESMETVGNTTVLSNYEGNTKEDTAKHILGTCQKELFRESSFCTRVTELEKTSPKEHGGFMHTLAGFLNAEQRVTNSDQERILRYKTYRERLMIGIDGKDDKLMTPNQFRQSEQYRKFDDLEHKLLKLKQKKKDHPSSKRTAEEILELTNEIKLISVNYHLGRSKGATADPAITNFIEQNFDKFLHNLDMPSLLLEGPNSENFKRITNKIEAQTNTQRGIIEGQLINELKEYSVDDKACEGESSQVSCIKKLCGVTSKEIPETCKGSEEVQAEGLDEIYPKVRSLLRNEESKLLVKSATLCMNKKQSSTEKKECLEALITNKNFPVKTDMKKLRKDLNSINRSMARQNSAEPFMALNTKKLMVLDGLKSLTCSVEPTFIEGTNCGESDQLNAGIEVMEFLSNGQNVSINLNNKIILDYLNENIPPQVMKERREDFIQSCQTDDKDPHKLTKLCKYYTDKKAWDEKVAFDKANPPVKVYVTSDEPEEELNYFSETAEIVGLEMVKKIPGFLNLFMQKDATRNQTRNQLEQINSYDDWSMKNLNAYRDGSTTNSSMVSNWGYPSAGFEYQDYSSFQANASYTSSLYNAQSPTNFSYNPTPTGNSTDTGSGSSSFGFKF